MTATQVQQLYVAYFNRPADTLGLAYWTGKPAAAASLEFSKSAEYAATYAGMSTAARVDAIYTNLFGRAAEPAGLKYWGGLIESGLITVSDAVTQIAKGAQGTDLTAYNNKVKAAEAFTTALDTTAEIVAYSGTAANNAAKAWMTGITTDATLTAATTTAALNASITGVITAGSLASGQSFNLSTNSDNLVGTGSNDTFTGLVVGALSTGSTAQAGDAIAGGAGVDTLSLNISGDAGGAFTIAGIQTSGVEKFLVSNYDANAGATTIDLSTASGLTTVGISNSSANGDTIFSNIQNLVGATAKGEGDLTLSYLSTVVSGTADAQSIEVDTFTAAITVSEFETVTLVGTNGNSTVSTLTTDGGSQDATRLVISGSKDVAITTDLNTNNAALVTIDASAATGKVNIVTSDADTNVVRLGAGGDTLTRNVQGNDRGDTDVFDGGAGTDTLKVTTGANISAANLVKYSSFERLELTDAATEAAINLAGVSMFNIIRNSDSTTGTTQVSNVAAGTNFEITVANGGDEALTASLASDVDDAATTITVGKTSGTPNGVNTGALTFADHETITLASVGGDNIVSSLVSGDLLTLNLTGAEQMTLTAATAANLALIDASAMTKHFIMGGTMGKSTATIKGGAGNDTLYAATSNSTVDAGAGDDIVYEVAGVDKVTLGSGDDRLLIGTFADLTSADSIDGGDGTDSIEFTAAANADFTADPTIVVGVKNIEKYVFSGLNGTDTVTVNDAVMQNGSIILEFSAAVTGANVANASSVLASGSKVTFTDKSAAGSNVYSIGNGVDVVDMGADADTVNVTVKAYLSASDTINGGLGSDTLQVNIDGGASSSARVTLSAADLAGVRGFETINIDDATATYIGITVTDAVTGANASSNAMAISATDGTTAFDGFASIDASAVTSTAMTLTGGSGNDTIKGGAGADELFGGDGTNTVTGGDGKDDFHVANVTTAVTTITDFNWGTSSSTGTQDQIEIDANYLGGANGADNAATVQTGANFAQVHTNIAGIGNTTDVAVMTDKAYTRADLDTAIEALDSAVVTQDFFVVYQDTFGNVRVAIAESDGSADSGADYTVTDAFIMSGITITGVASSISADDFIVV
jgi:S-layer protein